MLLIPVKSEYKQTAGLQIGLFFEMDITLPSQKYRNDLAVGPSFLGTVLSHPESECCPNEPSLDYVVLSLFRRGQWRLRIDQS